ncbi:MAG: penicillin-binding protein 2 [Coriobacteriaceae bacterium]|nr:penicillin-binding protein 2 [Coriobacteriaceae bacterium]
MECNEASLSRRKFIYGGVALAAGAVGLRLGDYQILNGEEYRARADSRRRTSETLYAKRGTIYDRNGNVLTSSVECKNVYVNPPYIKKKDRRRAIDALSEVLGMPRDVVRDLVDSEQNFQYIKRRVDEEDAETLSKLGIEGMGFEPAVKRVYPNGNLASQLLGTVNVDNIGASGIEQHYNDVLTGKNGELSREKALRGGFIAGGEYEKTPAEDGMDLVLSIDVNIQRAAEEAIAEVVERVDAKNGSVMVVDPTNGEILCACSYPTFDPTDTDSADIADFNLRMVTDVYEPGSVFKSFVTAAAIEHEGMTPDTSFNVPAMVRVGDDEVRDADKRDYSMTMTLREMMRRSSNTGLVLVGEKIGADDFDKHVIGDFGFGTSTGIDFPGESLGIIKKRSEYDGATLGSMSFGQALAVEPVQMVRAMSAIANKGVMTTPHFVKARAGEELDWTSGEKRAISAETAAAVASMMLTVVDEGTGELAQVPGYEVSGKTGTAERAAEGQKGYLEDNYMSSFMGFVSTSDPRVLCYVTLDGTAAGSDAATPVFRKIMDTALPTLGIKPTR